MTAYPKYGHPIKRGIVAAEGTYNDTDGAFRFTGGFVSAF